MLYHANFPDQFHTWVATSQPVPVTDLLNCRFSASQTPEANRSPTYVASVVCLKRMVPFWYSFMSFWTMCWEWFLGVATWRKGSAVSGLFEERWSNNNTNNVGLECWDWIMVHQGLWEDRRLDFELKDMCCLLKKKYWTKKITRSWCMIEDGYTVLDIEEYPWWNRFQDQIYFRWK